MATKAQQFKAQQTRTAKPPKPKRQPRRRRDPVQVDTSEPGVSATDRKVGGGRSGTRNLSNSAGAKGGAKLEDSATGKASRKSTRKSSGRIKRTTNQQLKAQRATRSPKARATAAKAKGTVSKARGTAAKAKATASRAKKR